MKHIIDKHVAACVAEIQREIQAEIARALMPEAGDTVVRPRKLSATRGKAERRFRRPPSRAPKRAPPRAKTARRPTLKISLKRSSHAKETRPCGCGPMGRHRIDCALAKVNRKSESSRKTDRSSALEMTTQARADRLAKLEQRARERQQAAHATQA